MSRIRRYFRPIDTAFLTHVTYNRMPILIDHFDLLWNAIQKYRRDVGFDLIAWVVMPDHFHILLSVDGKDISSLIKKIKLSFSSNYRKALNIREGRVWQFRFWDHIIRNQEDLNHHIDYIHYNPVDHGKVSNPSHWRYSSFMNYIRDGVYQSDWGIKPIKFDGEYGE
jgi:putative transposase